MPALLTQLTSFNCYPKQTCNLHRPERYRDLLTPCTDPMITRGQGNSYGDAALNEHGHVISTERLNRFITFDAAQGILTAEAGVTLANILSLIVPKGWFLPVTPGTQQVSLGGCIAADVHGKNHHRTGSFSAHIIWLELITAEREILRCSAKENPDVYWATIGGMGLTGIIGTVCLKLLPCKSNYLAVTHRATHNLAQTIEQLETNEFDDDYSVAWLDTTVKQSLGRGIIMTAHHANPEELLTAPKKQLAYTPQKTAFAIPFFCPTWVLNKTLVKFLQQLYWQQQLKASSPFFCDYQRYFYPLDRITHWNRLYGKRGFIQYQCVIPSLDAKEGYKQLLSYLQTTSYPVFLAVLKKLGPENLGRLSFPTEGFTLALDLPLLDHGLFAVLDRLDEIVVAHRGRIYLAKDARLKPEMFRQMYPRFTEWLKIKNQLDPRNLFSSSLSRRLELC